MNAIEHGIRIRELAEEATSFANDDSICHSYRIFLFLEILAKPRYSRLSIKVKDIRMILKRINGIK